MIAKEVLAFTRSTKGTHVFDTEGEPTAVAVRTLYVSKLKMPVAPTRITLTIESDDA